MTTNSKNTFACLVIAFAAFDPSRATTGEGASAVVTLTAPAPGFRVISQVVGPMHSRSYLLYDTAGKEAALFDVGGPVPLLEKTIRDGGLRLKYIFNTHGHVDHVQGIAAIRAHFPAAKWCISRPEFESMSFYARWEQVFTPAQAAKMKAAIAQSPALAETMAFDFAQLGEPDIWVSDNQEFRLGSLSIRALLCRGHSAGGVCFHAGRALFSGDVLFYRHVGRADLPRSGGPAALEASVRRLYALPDDTVVYPGHGRTTAIGPEKALRTGLALTDAGR